MHYRSADFIENGFVHLDVRSLELERDVLAKLMRGVTHQSFEPLERLTYRHHSTLGDFLLQTSHESRRLRYNLDEIDIPRLSRQLRPPSSRNHEPTDQSHQRVETLCVDAYASLSIRYRKSRHSRSERRHESLLLCRSQLPPMR